MFTQCIRFLSALGIAVSMTMLGAACSMPATVARPEPAAEMAGLDTAALDSFVAEMLNIYDVPGAAIAIVLPDGGSYTQGYGVRDTASGASTTAQTMFALGSTTKSFTALGVMLLVQDGLVDLDAPVSTYLPEYRLADPAATAQVTVRHLLSHTTGLAYDSSTVENQGMSEAELLALVARIPVAHAPGSTFIYNNVNTDIAGVLIARVSGQPYTSFIRERVFAPLGMATADFDFSRLPQKPDYSALHKMDVVAGMQPIAFYPIGVDLPAAGIIASAADLEHYLLFQLTGRAGDGTQILRPELLAEMHRRQISAAGPLWTTPERAAAVAQARGIAAPQTLLNDPGYAFYWMTSDFEGHPMVWHNGGGAGLISNITLLPKSRAGVAILANADRATDFTDVVSQHVAELLLDIQPRHDTHAIVQGQREILGDDVASRRARLDAARTFRADAAQLAALTGAYLAAGGGEPILVEVVSGGRLRLTGAIPGLRIDAELMPYAPTEFLINSGELKGAARVSFESEPAGATNVVLILGDTRLPLARRSS